MDIPFARKPTGGILGRGRARGEGLILPYTPQRRTLPVGRAVLLRVNVLAVRSDRVRRTERDCHAAKHERWYHEIGQLGNTGDRSMPRRADVQLTAYEVVS